LPHIDEWRRLLVPIGFGGGWCRRPDVLLRQITDGVSLGYNGDRTGFIVRSNHPSALLPEATAVVDQEFVDELRLRRMAGPFTHEQARSLFPFFRTSPMAVVPKSDGGWRIIDDLSNEDADGLPPLADIDALSALEEHFSSGRPAPRPTVAGATPSAGSAASATSALSAPARFRSVNAHIPDEEARVRYHSFDEAVRMVRRLGRGCWLAKVDWKAAFRQIAVCRADWPLLGLHWRGRLFVRLVLPFGARSSPARFTQFAQVFAGILRHSGAKNVMFYLDDFLLAGASEAECAAAVAIMESIARQLGVTLHPTKRDGPAQAITFLGIGLDTVQMRMTLPPDKKRKVRDACTEMLADARGVSLAQLRSVTGLLLHAGRVVQPGRLMTRRLVELLRGMLRRRNARPHERVALPSDARADLQWWISGLDEWDGTSLIPLDDSWADPIVTQTDACTSDGAGAVLFATPPVASAAAAAASSASADEHQLSAWFHYAWPPPAASPLGSWPIPALEMAAVAIALDTFGPRLRGRCIRLHSDSAAVVGNVRRHSPASELNMRLLRGIHATAWTHDVRIALATHIPGARNVFADAASRLSAQTPEQLAQLGLSTHTRLEPSVPRWLLDLAASFPVQPRRQ
jgi:hypothetical protein